MLRGNFDAARDAVDADFNEDLFEATREKYAGARRRAERDRRTHARREFARWSAARRGRTTALACLRALRPPAWVARANSAPAALRYWRRVGALLKAVDAALLPEWVAWSRLRADGLHAATSTAASAGATRRVGGDVFEWARSIGVPASPAGASAVWCALAPRGCDVARHPACGGGASLSSAGIFAGLMMWAEKGILSSINQDPGRFSFLPGRFAPRWSRS